MNRVLTLLLILLTALGLAAGAAAIASGYGPAALTSSPGPLECHNTAGWKPAAVSLAAVLQTNAGTCATCHSDKTDCRQCHNTQGWIPAEFDHTPFGKIPDGHVRRCTSCHN